MTPAEKRAKRQAKHDLQRVMMRAAIMKNGFSATTGQLHASAKTLTDRYYAEVINPAARAIEQKVLSDNMPRPIPEAPANG